MISIGVQDESLCLTAGPGDLQPRNESQLQFWGFTDTGDGATFVCETSEPVVIASKVVAYFDRVEISYMLDATLQAWFADAAARRAALNTALSQCAQFKDGVLDNEHINQFRRFARGSLARPLKSHQFNAAAHLLLAKNGANFSVPGSGKTAVVLSVFEYLRQQGDVDSLFVIGPPACFAPWIYEYRAVLGHSPRYERLAGGDVDLRRTKYLVDVNSVPNLLLTTFQTLERDCDHVQILLERSGVRFFLVVDEAHYIKQIGGVWARAVLKLARFAVRRCVLTGTPFPKSYADSFNLMDALWPDESPISTEHRTRIVLHSQRGSAGKAAEILTDAIAPICYRVRKADLCLAEQVFYPPIQITMRPRERFVYDSIVDRIKRISKADYFRDFDTRIRLRRGRMMRLRQCISCAALLATALSDSDEDLIGDDASLAATILRYNEFETPAKVDAMLDIVRDLLGNQQKVVIWSNFVGTLHMIQEQIMRYGCRAGLIYGGTPTEDVSVSEEQTREEIIAEFTDPRSTMTVLVANPAACAESVSLHKSCSHAIYYDLSYNAAQYLQSLDRIHRVGGSETKPSHYFILQYSDTIDTDIVSNLLAKTANMAAVIDQPYPIYSLDMFEEDQDELDAYDRLFTER